MPDVAPSGAISEAVGGLRDLIAASSWFQTWVGAGDATAAAAHILIGEVGLRLKSAELASDVATFVTHEPHNLAEEQAIEIEGLGEPYDGSRTVDSVVDERTFTCAITADDQEAEEFTEEMVAKLWPAQRPWLVIMPSESNPLTFQHIGTGPAAIVSGELLVFADVTVGADYRNDSRNAQVEMTNGFSQLMDALARLSEDFHSWTVEDPPAFVREQEHMVSQIRFERWNALLRCQWGLEA